MTPDRQSVTRHQRAEAASEEGDRLLSSATLLGSERKHRRLSVAPHPPRGPRGARNFTPQSAQRRSRTRDAFPRHAPHSLFSSQDWSANPMFERKDNKKEALLDLDGRLINLNKRYTAVKEAGLRIQAMVAVRSRRGPWGTRLPATGGRAGESVTTAPVVPETHFKTADPPNGAWGLVSLVQCLPTSVQRVQSTTPALHKTGADKGQLPARSPRLSPGARCWRPCTTSGSADGHVVVVAVAAQAEQGR